MIIIVIYYLHNPQNPLFINILCSNEQISSKIPLQPNNPNLHLPKCKDIQLHEHQNKK